MNNTVISLIVLLVILVLIVISLIVLLAILVLIVFETWNRHEIGVALVQWSCATGL